MLLVPSHNKSHQLWPLNKTQFDHRASSQEPRRGGPIRGRDSATNPLKHAPSLTADPKKGPDCGGPDSLPRRL
ncbi:hypothetical protein AOLI_G00305850 [Acnodon oligacanthus]